MRQYLGHLPGPPSDFRQLARGCSDWPGLTGLATYNLDNTQLELLAKAINRVRADAPVDPNLSQLRLGIVSNATTDFLAAPITASALRHGINADVAIGEYGQVLQDVLNPSSFLYQPACDAILVALDHRGFSAQLAIGVDHTAAVEQAVDLLTEIKSQVHAVAPTTVVFQTVPPPPEPLFGGRDAITLGTQRSFVADLNAAIRNLVSRSDGCVLFDVEALANSVGLLNWHDPKLWNLAKLPFAQEVLPLYSEHLVRLLSALRGKSRKCLVLDLDNTLWGGVIGDDGLAGIELGQGSAVGEAFLDVQRTALALRERGIILAVCSKNDDSNARLPFRKHPEMLLREDHISVLSYERKLVTA
jgi:predicted enzyme involved in methoxymalonyl-ACP biosynthesis